MADERAEVLRQALKMEEDGKAFYENARDRTQNTLGKNLFTSLIAAEERHIFKIQKLYATLEETGKWPGEMLVGSGALAGENVFTQAMAGLDKAVKGTSDDLEALRLALDMERKGKKFYEERAESARDAFEKKFYALLAQEEGEHFLTIWETIDYLEDPGAYFHQKEITRGFH